MSRELRDLETKRGLLAGGSRRTRESLLKLSLRTNRDVLDKRPGAVERGRRLGRAQHYLARRMAKRGEQAPRFLGF